MVQSGHAASRPPVQVREVSGPDEMRACQALQSRAWGITEDGYVVPVATMIGVQKMGGSVLGAFEGNRLVGFTFAFLGRFRGELVLYSQLAAVDPGRQGSGVGKQIKLAQRARAAEMGLGRVVWAFDPLQAGNAAFNLASLGAVSRTYEVDLYGARSDSLNAGLATDRLLAEWPTEAGIVGRATRRPDGIDLLTTEPTRGGLRRPFATHRPSGEHLHVEVPAAIGAVKQAGGDLALEWQRAIRGALQDAFGAGYVAVGFARGERPCYVLTRDAEH